MDWKDLAGTLVKAGAPIIGTALGGPLGGMIGGAIGGVVADALGVESSPEAIDTAIRTMPADQVAAKLSAADTEAQAKWPALAEIAKAEAEDRTAQSQAINETIRQEIGKVSWWHWRHLLGYVVVVIGSEVAVLMPLVVMGKITPLDMANLIGAITPFMMTVAGLLGFVAQDTTRQKITAATGAAPPTLTQQLTGAVKAAVKKR